MDVIEAILGRRSVRAYEAEPVSEEVLHELVEAGIWAPSGGNAQTWRFVVVTEPRRIRQLRMLSPGLLGEPPAVIVICQDVAEAERRGDKLGKEVLTLMDTAMAAQNIMLAAYAEGLGTCAVCSFHPGGVQKLLRLPENIVPQMLVSVGIPKTIIKPPKRRLDVIWFDEYTERDGSVS